MTVKTRLGYEGYGVRRRAVSAVISGTLAVTEGQDTAAFTGTVSVSGILAATEAPDVLAFTYTLPSGTLAATEAPDIASIVAAFVQLSVARWVLDISAKDEGQDIDFTGAEVALAIKDYDGYQRLSATIGNGLTLTSATEIQLRVTPDQWPGPGAYQIGAVYRISGATYQIFTGQLTIEDDVARLT